MDIASVTEAIDALVRHEMVLVVDDDRGGYGSLVVPAATATTGQAAFLVRQPVTMAVKVLGGRRSRDDLPAACEMMLESLCRGAPLARAGTRRALRALGLDRLEGVLPGAVEDADRIDHGLRARERGGDVVRQTCLPRVQPLSAR